MRICGTQTLTLKIVNENFIHNRSRNIISFRFQQEIPEYPPRLFLCSNATGRFVVEEIFNFTQEDVEEDDIMLLDTHDTIFLWVGKDANQTEKKEAMTTALV